MSAVPVSPDSWATSTRLVHGAGSRSEGGPWPVAAPVYLTSTFRAEDEAQFQDMATIPMFDRFYTRYGNPTHAHTAALLAQLEGAEAGCLTASGMGAITTAVLASARAGDHIIGQRVCYGGVSRFLESKAVDFGLETTVVDQTDIDAFQAALRPNTRVVLVESPSNPLLQITDIAAVARLCRANGITLIADNTFATPLQQRPIELGADIVVHSASKYLSGHSDVVAGAILGSAAHVERAWDRGLTLGATLGPMEAWLLARGLRTLELRVSRQSATAGWLAPQLVLHPVVRQVTYPGLSSHPQHDLARRQMRGFGGMIGLELHGGTATADEFLRNLPLFIRAASLGGIESLAVRHMAMMAGFSRDPELNPIPDDYIRLSIGIEAADDLWRALNHALNAALEGRVARAAINGAAAVRRLAT